jgi:sensor histidine kinase YesM
MHKPEGGMVGVKVEAPETDCLRITITDDGVGRAAAAQLKSKSATKHKSFGMKLTGERISLINRLYDTTTRVQVHDLTDAEGNPAGTEVVLEIPI